MKDKIMARIDFYENTLSGLADRLKDEKEKYMRRFIREQIRQCIIAIEVLNELLKDLTEH